MAANTPPPVLDPPFRGYIETTFDALLVFEAARRGMIPRVTRRLIERERGMVQSGAVFVFDEHESGIKRWTDGLVWSPSRILGNFLVYRETDKKPTNNPPTPMTNSGPASTSPQQNSPASLPPGMQQYDPNRDSILGHGALPRPRSGSDGGAGLDRQRERQLVGSLTNSYKFKENGLVKKTMSVTVNGFAQHMISYYSVEDVLHGKLRTPSTIPELASLEISAEYLHKQNFRFPPMIEVGPDGIPRYRGEPEEPQSPTSPVQGGFAPEYDVYGQPRQRSRTVPMPIPMSSPAPSYVGPSSSTSAYFDHSQMASPPPLIRQASNSSMTSTSGALRPSSSSRRYDPYNPSSPRTSVHSRRQSQPVVQPIQTDYYGQPADIKPTIVSPTIPHTQNPYHYQPPATAPSSFSDFGAYAPPPIQPSGHYAPQYATWHAPPSGRFHQQHPRDYAPPSSAGSSGSASHQVQQHPPVPVAAPPPPETNTWNQPIVPQPHAHTHTHTAGWDPGYPMPDSGAEWRGQGTSVG